MRISEHDFVACKAKFLKECCIFSIIQIFYTAKEKTFLKDERLALCGQNIVKTYLRACLASLGVHLAFSFFVFLRWFLSMYIKYV